MSATRRLAKVHIFILNSLFDLKTRFDIFKELSEIEKSTISEHCKISPSESSVLIWNGILMPVMKIIVSNSLTKH